MKFQSAFFGLAGVAGFALTSVARADGLGAPRPGQIGNQEPVTQVARDIWFFHNWILMPIITIISLFVLALLAYVIWRFNEKANPVPSKTTHNTLIEVLWTVLPVLILVVIAIPSFKLLTLELVIPPSDMTIKVTASQWHWNYAYPSEKVGFDSFIKDQKDIDPSKGDIWLLSVDNEVVVPVNKTVLLQITSADVIHSFIVQAFGTRVDAVPGRLNETWFKAEQEGVYYGQCSKLCGKDHAFMPIAFRVVSQDKYDAWLADAKKKFAISQADGGVTVAAAATAQDSAAR
jgi:cytochrome c oxidase subunit II